VKEHICSADVIHHPEKLLDGKYEIVGLLGAGEIKERSTRRGTSTSTPPLHQGHAVGADGISNLGIWVRRGVQ